MNGSVNEPVNASFFMTTEKLAHVKKMKNTKYIYAIMGKFVRKLVISYIDTLLLATCIIVGVSVVHGTYTAINSTYTWIKKSVPVTHVPCKHETYREVSDHT
jgi:ABC-type uncharacterized transport system permease subunit